MDINDLFDGIMKSINQFAFDASGQRLQEKMQDNGLERSEQMVREPQASPAGMPLRSRAQSGRGSENGGKTRRPRMAGGDSRKAGREATGDREVACNRDMTSFPKREWSGRRRRHPGSGASR